MGGGGEGGGGGHQDFGAPLPQTAKSIGGGETSPRDLGAHLWVHTEGPPPPHDGPFQGGGQEGIKRWGIEALTASAGAEANLINKRM